MKNKTLPIIIALVVLVVVGGVVLMQKSGNDTYVAPSQQTPAGQTAGTQAAPSGTEQGTSGTASAPASYTLAQVAEHKDASSCWSAINGNVYDLTSWISQHPGGERAILGICGKDGSAAFNRKHGGQSKPEQTLETFKIGALAK